jgi:hypothetical protein
MEFNDYDADLREDKQLISLGIDPDLPPLIILMMLENKVRTVEQLFAKLREKHPDHITTEDGNRPSCESSSA